MLRLVGLILLVKRGSNFVYHIAHEIKIVHALDSAIFILSCCKIWDLKAGKMR